MSGVVSQKSRELFDAGFYCAESVLLAMAGHKGIHSDLIPRIATGFCSGMSRTCEMCGAVTGGIMAIGMVAGRSSPDDSVEKIYLLVRRLMDMFRGRFGSLNCRELTGCDLGTQEGRAKFHADNLSQRCRQYTAEAAAMTLLLIEGQAGPGPSSP